MTYLKDSMLTQCAVLSMLAICVEQKMVRSIPIIVNLLIMISLTNGLSYRRCIQHSPIHLQKRVRLYHGLHCWKV